MEQNKESTQKKNDKKDRLYTLHGQKKAQGILSVINGKKALATFEGEKIIGYTTLEELTEESILVIDELINKYNNQVRTKINGIYISLDDKKKIINDFLKEVPSQLMILRNHLKNCSYSTNLSDFKFKYEKYVDEDFKRLTYIRH